jgi:hypothetical protein
MQAVTVTPGAIEAFQSFYLAELDARVQRSEVVGAITLKKGNAALFFEPTEGKFTLVEKMPDVEAANVFDCVPREQWGRTVMLFGHATNTGGYIASGHATLEGNSLKIKLASGSYYRLDVDGTLAHLQAFVGDPPVAKPQAQRPAKPRQERQPPARANKSRASQFGNSHSPRVADTEQVSHHLAGSDECEDLTEEDLRRLRGEMPLTTKPKKKWQH